MDLLQNNNEITTVNPILKAFSLDYCEKIDDAVNNDEFIKSKRNNIIKNLNNCTVGHDDYLKPAFDEYNEAVTYLSIKNKNLLIDRVKEVKGKNTPDFQITSNNKTFYIEMKTLGFADGDLNYVDAVNKGLESQISLEQQINNGRNVAIAETFISPFFYSTKEESYNQLIQTRIIETIVNKINNNLKEEQFKDGKTILLIDLSLMLLPYDWKSNSVPIFQENLRKSMVSGIFWYSAFGKLDERIFSTIEFEGAKNIEGKLRVEGILNNYPFIKALCFQTYNVSKERKVVGLHRSQDQEMIDILLPLCDFLNDEFNTKGYEVLQGIEPR
jgi:hypothetical protein